MRVLFAEKLCAVASKPKLSDVDATLRGVRSLSSEHRAAALRAMRDAGHVEDDVNDDSKIFAAAAPSSRGGYRLSPMAAAGQSAAHEIAVQKIMKRAARMGYHHENLDEPIVLHELDQALSACRDIELRIALKTDMRMSGLL